MRLGLDLRAEADPDRRRRLAVEADDLGLWAVLVEASSGAGLAEAAALATATEHVHLALWLDLTADHPVALAEEVAVLDHLSERRTLVVADGEPDAVDRLRRLLAGAVVDGVALTPPPAQTAVPVWSAAQVPILALSGEVGTDGPVVDDGRDGGATHRFVTWPGPLSVLARHLATRASEPAFPALVAELADHLENLDG